MFNANQAFNKTFALNRLSACRHRSVLFEKKCLALAVHDADGLAGLQAFIASNNDAIALRNRP